MGRLTQGIAEPFWLVIMHDGYTQRVEPHHAQHDPVKALGLHHAADEESKTLLLAPEVGGAVVLCALHTGPGKGSSWSIFRGQTHSE